MSGIRTNGIDPVPLRHNAMKKRKTLVADLVPGMYVCELDRSWLETPFLFQGFWIRDQNDVDTVGRFCNYVYIDIQRGLDPDAPAVIQGPLVSPGASTLRSRAAAPLVPLEEELSQARRVRTQTHSYLDQVFEDVRLGRSLDLADAKVVVSDMVSSIVRNPNAQLCLTQLKERDAYTAQHSVNVCVLSVTFARYLGMSEPELNLLGLGALLHDIGKLHTPLEILNKPARLTDEEFKVMQSHPGQGRDILRRIRGMPESAVDIAFTHHERLAGHGYPNRLHQHEISAWSKLVAVVDVYDAITSDRSYHDGMAATEALTRMYQWRERDFDPALMEQFIQCIGIYPVGTLVELTSDEVGIVISVNPEARLRPRLLLVRDGRGNPYFPSRVCDLSQHEADGDQPYGIRGVLEPGSLSIDVKEHIRQLGVSR